MSRVDAILHLANDDIDSAGLVGVIDGLTYAPDIEQGFFDPEPGVIYPQTIKLFFGYTVIHTHQLGWANKKSRIAFRQNRRL